MTSVQVEIDFPNFSLAYHECHNLRNTNVSLPESSPQKSAFQKQSARKSDKIPDDEFS